MKAFVVADLFEPAPAFEIARANGYGIETQVIFRHDRFSADWIEDFAGELEGFSPLSMHGPIFGMDPGSTDPDVLDLTWRTWRWARDFGVALGVEHIIAHGDRAALADDVPAWMGRAVEFWRSFLDESPPNLMFYIENTFEASVEHVAELVDRLDDRRVKANIDIGHAHCETVRTVVEALEYFGSRLGYAHLHTNDGTEDQHLALGVDSFPTEEVCCALEENAPDSIWCLEAEPQSRVASLRWLAEKGFLPDVAGLAG